MIKLKLEKDIIVKRMDGIESEIADLNKLKVLTDPQKFDLEVE